MVTDAWDSAAKTISAERYASALSRVSTYVHTFVWSLHILNISHLQVWIQNLFDWDLAEYLEVHQG